MLEEVAVGDEEEAVEGVGREEVEDGLLYLAVAVLFVAVYLLCVLLDLLEGAVGYQILY